MPAPYRLDVVDRIHRQNPGLIAHPHTFTNAVAYALWKEDPNWGHNIKRGTQGLSEDAICYLDPASPLKTKGGQGIWIIDIIGSAGSPTAAPAWIDQTVVTVQKGETGGWSQPTPPAHTAPAPPPPVPPPTPAPCRYTVPDLTGLLARVTQIEAQLEALTHELHSLTDLTAKRIIENRVEVEARLAALQTWMTTHRFKVTLR